MKFNSDIFQAIRFAELFTKCDYTDDADALIKQMEIVKDLGIYMSQDMTFDSHIRTVANKGKQLAGWILRTFHTRSPTVMLTLLKQLIYPTTEYNSVLWSPTSEELIKVIESVQKNFIKKISTDKLPNDSDYRALLQHFKLYSLQRRRERYAIIYIWKVVHGLYPNPGLDMPNPNNTNNQTRSIQVNVHQRSDITVHYNTHPPKWLNNCSVLERCCALYNHLPLRLRTLVAPDKEPSIDDFKKELDKWLEKIPDEPTVSGRGRRGKTNSIIDQLPYSRN